MSEAKKDVAKGEYTSFNENLSNLNYIDYKLQRKDVFDLLSFSPSSAMESLSVSNLLYLVDSIPQEKDRLCRCCLYRSAIYSFFNDFSLDEILDKRMYYQQIALILRKSINECNDSKSLMLRTVLSIGKGIGYSALLKESNNESLNSKPNKILSIEKVILFWLLNDYDTAYEHMRKIDGHNSADVIELRKAFMESYDSHKQYHNVLRMIKEANESTTELNDKLKKEINLRDKELSDIISFDIFDAALFIIGNADIKKPPLSKAAKGIGNIIALVDMIQMVKSAVDVYETQEKVKALDGRKARLHELESQIVKPRDENLMSPKIDRRLLKYLIAQILSNSAFNNETLSGGCRP